ncbi:uncharacterized protein BT62DRAFT_1012560 [Guyanagaster necrorhizus]|uniref:Uncharacterized protein n=1 Tax=Guyanagaster necrorhizus TaxID=856835 RepID=A0A9P7VGL4_9AGAR|nr:uncharacterized protein BT62DRAFT_1012560 [Guyanagaster necrorhizus MCA 3950]KAG7440626.1 hypothetical protein BT62DRAFT_1012560 [Guyanagaster necrorhizus MCA 3950]
MSDRLHYKKPLAFNEYVESMPEDFRRAPFDRVLDRDWDGARKPWYDFAQTAHVNDFMD